MTYQIFEKLLKGNGCVTSEALSADEKKKIYEVMQQKGMSNATAYNRFFRDGFNLWEVQGVKMCIDHYVKHSDLNITPTTDLCLFYKSLERKAPFKQYMSELGMSQGITIARFNGFNFKPWEIEGIENIIKENFID